MCRVGFTHNLRSLGSREDADRKPTLATAPTLMFLSGLGTMRAEAYAGRVTRTLSYRELRYVRPALHPKQNGPGAGRDGPKSFNGGPFAVRQPGYLGGKERRLCLRWAKGSSGGLQTTNLMTRMATSSLLGGRWRHDLLAWWRKKAACIYGS